MDYSPKKKKPNNQNKRLNSKASKLRNAINMANSELGENQSAITASNKSNKTVSKETIKHLRGERIQKILANLGFGSRREIERLISEGKVQVNNEIATLGQHLLGDELIKVKGRRVVLSDMDKERKTKIIALHKPVGVVSTRNDEAHRPTVFDKLPPLKNARWVMIGRLDINTQGLLLFTNDGKLANLLMHPSSEIEREYLVRVFGEVNNKTIEQLRTGIELEDGFAAFDEIVAVVNEDEDEKSAQNLFYKVTLKEGKNREVRRLWEAVNCQVSRLKRIRYGNYEIPKTLKLGKTVELTSTQVNQLRNLIKLNKDDNEVTEVQNENARAKKVQTRITRTTSRTTSRTSSRTSAKTDSRTDTRADNRTASKTSQRTRTNLTDKTSQRTSTNRTSSADKTSRTSSPKTSRSSQTSKMGQPSKTATTKRPKREN